MIKSQKTYSITRIFVFMTAVKKETWSSRLGFIITTAGAAVGLGNIQRFPYLASEGGGALFLMTYLLCVIILGLPLMLNEFAIGRKTHHNPVSAIEKLTPNKLWLFPGYLGILTAFFIYTYYIVATSWTLSFVFQTAIGRTPSFDSVSNSFAPLFLIAICVSILIYNIVNRGIKNGIEKMNKKLMPLLVFLMIALVIRCLFLENAFSGITYYLYPDFSELNIHIVLLALSQAFFSLCIGEAVLITYASYTKSSDNLLSSAIYISIFDTFIAILSGFIIFPALFSFGWDVKQGSGIIYNVMPMVFNQLPLGNILSPAFFLILSFAALMTLVALIEMPIAYLIEKHKFNRTSATRLTVLTGFILSIFPMLSKGSSSILSNMTLFGQTGFYDIMDFTWGGLGMIITGFFTCLFTVKAWGVKNAHEELKKGCPAFDGILGTIWKAQMTYVIPLLILIILGSFLLF